jgi:hypothetical protein
MRQVPVLHVADACAKLHTRPHVPQLVMLDARFASHPFVALMSQSA